MTTQRSQKPWWLTQGTETCHACTHKYAYHTERRCASCDRGVCVHCSVTVRETRAVFCPECATDAAQTEEE